MALAEYNMLREKAIRGEMLIVSDPEGHILEVPAREQFLKMYGEELPQPSSIPVVAPAAEQTDSEIGAFRSKPDSGLPSVVDVPEGAVAPSEPIPAVVTQPDNPDGPALPMV